MGNKNMHAAKRNKNDEFYTQIGDIERELINYREQLENKIVYCNCDTVDSNFYKYFKANFKDFKLKKLYISSLDGELIEYDGVNMIAKKINGDFRSEDSIDILKQSDVVITNPPFSLFREYVAQSIEYEKEFLIMGNNNAITYKEIFPLLKDNKMWLGYHSNKTMEFRLPDYYEKWDRVDEDGNKYGKVPAISWFTNIDVSKRHEDIFLYKDYKGNEDDYPKYDNYDAIEVSRVKDIPRDYEGIMGVPITFLTKHSPLQFEILGITDRQNTSGLRTKKYTKDDDSKFNDLNARSVILKNGEYIAKYARILIKNKNPEIKEDIE